MRVRALCDKYDLPYTTGPWWAVLAVVLDDREARAAQQLLKGTSDDAPETNSELKFSEREPREVNGKRYGLRSAIKGRNPRSCLASPQRGQLPDAQHQHDRSGVGQRPVARAAQP